jgi:predicted Zn-dependent protease
VTDTVISADEPAAALRRRAEDLIGVRRYEDALHWAGRAIASEPENVRSHCLRALALLHLGRYRDALRAAEAAGVRDPADEWPHRLRSAILLRQGKKRPALAAAREAARLAPDQPETLYAFTMAELACRHLDAAEAAANRLTAIAPERLYAHLARGQVALARGRSGQAEAAFRDALALNAQSPEALGGLGVALYRQRKRREAIDRFHDAARADPTGTSARQNLHAALRWHLRPLGLFVATVAIFHIWRLWHGAVPALGPAAVATSGACIAGMLWLRNQRLQTLPADLAFLARHERTWAPPLSAGRTVKIVIGIFMTGLALNFANFRHWAPDQWYELVLLSGTLVSMLLWLA